MGVRVAKISESYFLKHKHFVEMLDPNDLIKQSERCYLFLCMQYDGNHVFIPLRKSIYHGIPSTGYPLPSATRPHAGFDFRKMLIVNDMAYVQVLTKIEIANSQLKKLTNDINVIEKMAVQYIEGYIKSAKKNREHIDAKYLYSTLHNFHNELKISKGNPEPLFKTTE